MNEVFENQFTIKPKQFFESMKKENFSIEKYHHVITFVIELPFHIPMPDGINLTFDDKNIISFHFNSIIKKQEIEPKKIDSTNIKSKRVSRVEISYTTKLRKKENIPIDIIFQKVIKQFNTFLLCYVQVMHDIEICELNSSNLQPVILYRILSVKTETCIGGGLLPITVKTIPTEKQILSAQECQNIVNHFWIFKSDKNPFFVIMKIYHNAYREYYKDNFAQSIIQMQTYIETFIKIVFSQIMSETGFFEQQINKIIEETPFLSLIKKKCLKN